MLTGREREMAAQAALRWPKKKAHLFMKSLLERGTPITSEAAVLRCLLSKPGSVQMAAPEVQIAVYRGQVTAAGIEQALRDLLAYCRSHGHNYLNLLDNNPEYLSDLLLEGVRQGEFSGI